MPTHGIRKRKSKKKYPLIEIMGPMDCGKQVIGSLVSRRLYGSYFSFPQFALNSPTGKILFLKHKEPEYLENNPHWWSNISLANMQEQASLIEEALLVGPVVVSNYLLSWKVWFSALGIDPKKGIHSLPQPNLGFKLENTSLHFSDLMLTNTEFSLEYMMKLGRKFQAIQDRKVVSIISEGSKFTHVEANSVAIDITTYVKEKYDISVNSLELYTKDNFIPKKIK